MDQGKIIFLNGVTSAGKTTIAKEIQQIADRNFNCVSNDLFQSIVSRKFLQENYWKYLSRAVVAMYHTAKALSEMDMDVIIDGMLLEEPEFLLNFQQSHYDIMKRIFSDSPLLMVEVRCPLEECRKRNIERGDRRADQSEWQYRDMAKNIEYDIIVDTYANTPRQCAEQILRLKPGMIADI